MSRYKIEAYVIRATRMSESSRVVTLFSKEMGKVKAVAKGVGRPKSKMSGAVELFNLIEGILYKKETADLGTLGSADVLQSYPKITSNARKYGFGSAWCEVLDKTSQPEHPRPETFALTSEIFQCLSEAEPGLSGLIFWSGLLKLLGIEGYAPGLEKCISCGKEKLGERISISLSRGGIVCDKCLGEDEMIVRVSSIGLELLRRMKTLPIRDLIASDHDRKAGREAAEVIISFASYHLGLPRQLKSFKFLESLEG